MSAPVLARLQQVLFTSRIYDLTLVPALPAAVNAVPFASKRSAAACAYAEGRIPAPPQPDGSHDGTFRWLADTGPDADGMRALNDWLQRHHRWDAHMWRTDVLAERLSHWLAREDRIALSLDGDAFTAWRRAIGRSAKHLSRASLPPSGDWRRLLVHRGRLAALCALSSRPRPISDALTALGRDVDAQILADGGHVSRSPAIALAALSLLTDMRDMLQAHGVEAPEGLISAIDRSVPFIKGLCHPDGGFALMQGASADTAALIEEIIAATGSKGRTMTAAPHTGFHRLRAGQTTILFDAGATPGRAAGLPAAGAFELSVGRMRLIGGCGVRLGTTATIGVWQTALARTAAQSTLIIDDKDGDIRADAHVERREHEGARLIEITHDAYVRKMGIQHRRTLYLGADGSDIRGEDMLTGQGSKPFSIRFHLHPDVSASMVAGGGEVILKPKRGRGWHFHTRYPVRLEDSVNFFDGRQHRAQQIVILGNHEPTTTTVKWRLAMEG